MWICHQILTFGHEKQASYIVLLESDVSDVFGETEMGGYWVLVPG